VNETTKRLVQLIFLTDKEALHLEQVAQRLEQKLPKPAAELENALKNPELIDTLESFSAKFSRLQDTLADKLLPTFLSLAGEKTGTVIENLNRAETLSLITNTQDWLIARNLRNKLVHECIEDYNELKEAIELAQVFTRQLIDTQKAIKNYSFNHLKLSL